MLMKLKILKVGRNSAWHEDKALIGAVIHASNDCQKQRFPYQIEQGEKPTRGGWWHYIEGTVIESPSDKLNVGFQLAGCDIFCKRLV